MAFFEQDFWTQSFECKITFLMKILFKKFNFKYWIIKGNVLGVGHARTRKRLNTEMSPKKGHIKLI